MRWLTDRDAVLVVIATSWRRESGGGPGTMLGPIQDSSECDGGLHKKLLNRFKFINVVTTTLVSRC